MPPVDGRHLLCDDPCARHRRVSGSRQLLSAREVREEEVESDKLNQLMAVLSIQSETLAAQSALWTAQAETVMLTRLEKVKIPAYSEVVCQTPPMAPLL